MDPDVSSTKLEQIPNVFYKIALAPFERIILQDVANTWQLEAHRFGEGDGDSELSEMLFNQWQWCHDVRTFIKEGLEEIEDDKTEQELYDEALHILGKITSAYSRNEFRIAYLRKDNPNFVNEVCTQHAPKIKFVPHERDQFHWKIMGAMHRKYPDEMEFWTNPATRRDIYNQAKSFWKIWGCQYEIWKIARMFHIRARRPDNAEKIVHLWMRSPRFKATLSDNAAALYISVGGVNILTGEVRSMSDQIYDDVNQDDNVHLSRGEVILDERGDASGRTDDGLSRTIASNISDLDHTPQLPLEGSEAEMEDYVSPEQLENNLISMNIEGGEVWAYLRETAFRTRTITPSILNELSELYQDDEDPIDTIYYEPGSYLEFIPWIELKEAEPPEEEFPYVSLPFPISSPHKFTSFVSFEAGSQLVANHHFFPEDEVFQHHVVNDYSSPGHIVKGGVLFVATPLDETDFLSDFSSFWSLWNDCAITVHESTGQYYLLQTIPGIQFRNLYRSTKDQLNALRFFREEVDMHELDHPNAASESQELRDMIGQYYSPRYQRLLHYIPDEQIVGLASKPLGQGKFGTVLSATWSRPTSLENKQSTSVPIVLKRISYNRTLSTTDGLEKFFRELDLTYTALSGTSTGWIEFYGITKLHPRRHKFSVERDTFWLVLERATEGNLYEFISRSGYETNWDFIILALQGIGNGLNRIHKREIAHCDLHEGNILVKKSFFPGEPGVKDGFQYSIVLCDLGEGKLIGDQASHSVTNRGKQLGPLYYRPPEVESGQPYTVKGDIYSFGVHIFNLLSQAVVSGDSPMVPEKLCQICERCLEPDPDRRPAIIEVIFELQRLHAAYVDKEEIRLYDFHTVASRLQERSRRPPRSSTQSCSIEESLKGISP